MDFLFCQVLFSPGREMRGCPRTRTQREVYYERRIGEWNAKSYILPRRYLARTSVEYCIAHNPLLLQLLGHWFTFIYRKCEHLAVGSSGRGLTRSRGHPHFVVASPSPVVPLLYHTLRDLSRGFSNFFLCWVMTSSKRFERWVGFQ